MALASKGRLIAGRYRVLGRLGAGGMAVVVLAEDERLGRKVAVKRLHAESADDAARRFEREAKLGASLNHPNIVTVYDTLADEDGVLIVMEYVDGRTLRQEMDDGPLPPARAIEVLCGMAAALDHAHGHGVVHRDVKPANVLIAARDGSVKLTDLGIATAAERTNITRSGVVLGTAAYMAPERLDGQPGGPAVDVYAVGAVAFEALSGRKAVTGKTAMEVARRVMSQPPPDLAESVPGTPRRAAEALQRALAKDPDERPGSAGELVRELSAAYAESVAPAPAAAAAAPEAAAPAPTAEREPAAVASPTPLPAPATAPGPTQARPERTESRTAARALPEPRRRRPAEPERVAPEPVRREPAATRSSGRRRARIVPAALAVAAAAVLGIVLLASSSGGGDKQSGRSGTAARSSSSGSTGSGSSGSGSSGSGSGNGGAAATPAPSGTGTTPAPAGGGARSAAGGDPSTPDGALSTLYTRAARDDPRGAWDLGTERLHTRQFRSYSTFAATFRTLESISFPQLEVTSQSGDTATVTFRSIARHTDHVDRCSGDAALVRQSGRWLVDRIGVDCPTH